MTAPATDPRFAWWAPFAAMVGALSGVVVVAAFLQGLAGLDGSSADGLSPAGTLAATFAQHTFLILASIGCAKITVARVTPGTFGWRRPALGKQVLLLAVLLYVAFQVFLQVFGALVDPNASDELPTDLGARDSTAALVAVAILVGIVAPLAEELFFRGFLFPALRGPLGWIPAALIAGGIFGAVHLGGTDAVFIPPLMVFGIVLCVLYQRTGSLLPGMGLHALNNGLALGTVLNWSALGTIASAALAPVLVVGIAWAVAQE